MSVSTLALRDWTCLIIWCLLQEFSSFFCISEQGVNRVCSSKLNCLHASCGISSIYMYIGLLYICRYWDHVLCYTEWSRGILLTGSHSEETLWYLNWKGICHTNYVIICCILYLQLLLFCIICIFHFIFHLTMQRQLNIVYNIFEFMHTCSVFITHCCLCLCT